MEEIVLNFIKNDDYINIIFNNNPYQFIDNYTIDGRTLLQFASTTDSIFFEKLNNKYYLIKDEIIYNKLLELAGLKEPEVYFDLKEGIIRFATNSDIIKIDNDSVDIIIDTLCEKLKKIGYPVNEEKIKNYLTKLSFYLTNDMHPGYHIVTKSILLNSLNVNSSAFHECLHALQHQNGNYKIFKVLGIGLIEGTVESVAISISNLPRSNYDLRYGGRWYNFKCDSIYSPEVAIVHQMEFLLNKKCTSSVVDADLSFFYEFINKYGYNHFIFIKHSLISMLNNDLKLRVNDESIDKIQRVLLKCFDIELKSVKDFETAKEYLDRLINFGGERIRTDFNHDEELNRFYNQKLEEIKSILLNNGFNMEEIQTFINQNKYYDVKFYNRYYPHEYEKRAIKDYKTQLKILKKDSKLYSFSINDKYYSFILLDDGTIYRVVEYDLMNNQSITNDCSLEIIGDTAIFNGQVVNINYVMESNNVKTLK